METFKPTGMNTVLIISSSLEEERQLQNLALARSEHDIRFVTSASFGQEAAWWIENTPAVLLVCLPEDETFHGYFVKKLNEDVPKDLPLILLVPTLSNIVMQVGPHFQKIKILRSPFAMEDVYNAISDYLTPREIGKQQGHQRYSVNQKASVEHNGQNFDMIIRNLSLSGAFIEYGENDVSIAPNDRVVVRIQLGEMKKEYEFVSRVVWARSLLPSGQGLCMGVTFIAPENPLL